jgi:hypothetical protein
MRTRMAGWILVAGLGWLAGPSVAATPIPAEADAEALRAASQAWMQAIEAKDRAALEAFLAPEFQLVAPGEAATTPREEWLRNAVGRDWSGFRYESLVPRVDGDHATVHSRLYFHVAPIPVELDAGIVDTWVRRDGRWQVSGRYLGESRAAHRMGFAAGAATALAAWGLWSLLRRLRRRRTRAGA